MTDKKSEPDVKSDTRLEWVEPEARALAVSETAMQPTVGSDGGSFPDCTLS
jgi:hypothetical protein